VAFFRASPMHRLQNPISMPQEKDIYYVRYPDSVELDKSGQGSWLERDLQTSANK
jgi:hypothetical protein